MSSTAGASQATEAPVSRVEAREFARRAVDHIGNRSEFSEWRSPGVRQPQLFRAKIEADTGVRYPPRAYVFPIQHRGTDVGFITIDAQQTENPVLAFGRGTPPQRNARRAVGVARSRGRSLTGRYLYHGGVKYGIETDAGMQVDLRGEVVEPRRAARSINALTPIETGGNDSRTLGVSADDGGSDGADEWDGPTDDEVYGVPNWTSSDDGYASSTSYGSGDDEWATWDGCYPIAASMAIGYHEGLDEVSWDVDEREEIIDEIHERVNTSDDSSGETSWWNLDKLDGYSASNHTYGVDSKEIQLEEHIHWSIDHDEPPVLNMIDGPYSEPSNGHAVTVVGYEHDVGIPVIDDHNYKVHTGYSDPPGDGVDVPFYNETPPEHINHGNWDLAVVTQIWTV